MNQEEEEKYNCYFSNNSNKLVSSEGNKIIFMCIKLVLFMLVVTSI
jgi:hypothetical protein